MNPFIEHKKYAMDSIATYYDGVAEEILNNDSQKYKDLVQENDELQQQYHVITEIFEYNKFSKDSYNKDELIAISKYYHNKSFLENLERMEIYKIGFHSAIEMLYPIRQVLKNAVDDNSFNVEES